jgi:hypothetical protein
VGGLGKEWGKRGEMTQTLYAHMNKIKIKKRVDIKKHLRHTITKCSINNHVRQQAFFDTTTPEERRCCLITAEWG